MRKRFPSFNLLEKLRALRQMDAEEMLSSLGKTARQPGFMITTGLFLMLIFGGAGYGLWQMQQSPPQPIAFNHQVHV